MSDLWRAVNLLGATGVCILAVAAYTLYLARWRAMRLGKRRMVPPRVVLLQALSVLAPHALMATWTLDRIGQPLLWELQITFTVSWLLAVGWLAPVVAFELSHAPIPPRQPEPGKVVDERDDWRAYALNLDKARKRSQARRVG